MRLFLTFLITLFFLSAKAQPSDLQFLGWYRMGYDFKSFNQPHLIGNSYYSTAQLNIYGANYPKNYLIEFDKNGLIQQDLFYKRDVEGNKIDFLAISSNGNQLFGYYSFEKGEKSFLYRAPIDTRNLGLTKNREFIMSGDKRRNIPGPLGDLNPREAIEETYFYNRLYSFIELPREKKTVILKREPDKISSAPRLKFVVMDENSNTILEGKVKLKGTNKHTEIVDVEIGNQSNLYFLTRTKNGPEQEYALTIFDAATGEDQTIRLNDKRYIQSLQLSVIKDQIMAAGFASERRNSNHWDLIASKVTVDQRSIRSFKTLEKGEYDPDDVIDIKSAGNTVYVIAKSFRQARYDPRVNPGIVTRTRFTPRETKNTTIVALDFDAKKKWKHVIPNFMRTDIYSYESYQEGYKDVLYDNYLYLEKDSGLVVVYCMNPQNDKKPKKNGKVRSVVFRNKKHFGVKAITFDDDGLAKQKIISENQNIIIPVPFLTQEATDGNYFMIGSRYSSGSVSIGRMNLK